MKPSTCLSSLLFLSVITNSQSYAVQQKLLPGDGTAEDSFGYSVAIDGATALVGAPNVDVKGTQDTGAAYVFALGAAGWQQQAKLVAEPAYAGDTLGGNVALKNNMAILGAMRRDDKGEDAGAVFAFERQKGTWTQTQLLTAIDANPGDAFGQSIALTEHFLVIGAPRSDALGNDSGAAYAFVRHENAWQFHGKLTAKDGAPGDLFGISVAIDGDTVLVGADLNDEKADKAGAVYAYVFDNNEWKQQAKLMAEDGAKTDIFGVRVALFGDTALISARRDDIEGMGVDAGSAYIFERTNRQWTQTQKLVAPDGKADDRFARGVALGENTALISAMLNDGNGEDAGALYVFKKQHNQWRFQSKVVASDGATKDKFGWNVAFSDNTAIIATPYRSDQGNASGAAYIHTLSN